MNNNAHFPPSYVPKTGTDGKPFLPFETPLKQASYENVERKTEEQIRAEERAKIYKDLLDIADKYENDVMKIVVDGYFNEK